MDKELEKALAKIRKSKPGLRIGTLATWGEKVEAIPSGNLALDLAIGLGGLPKGRQIELFGAPSSGKSTTGFQAAGEAQKTGQNIGIFDWEQAIDPEYMAALGLDMDDDSFILSQPDNMEDGIDAIQILIESGTMGLIVVDSIAAMSTKKEIAGDLEKRFQDKSNLMAQACRKLNSLCPQYGTTVIWINHVQTLIDMTPMGQKLASTGVKRTTTPGGDALKFFCSLRIEYKDIGSIRGNFINPITLEEEDMIVARTIKATCVKNKVGAPFRSAEMLVRFGKGFSNVKAALDVLVARKVVKLATGIYRLPEELRGQSMTGDWLRGKITTIVEQIEEEPEWAQKLIDAATKLIADEKEARDSKLVENFDNEMIEEPAVETQLVDQLASSPTFEDLVGNPE